jgi:hypothetical protein
MMQNGCSRGKFRFTMSLLDQISMEPIHVWRLTAHGKTEVGLVRACTSCSTLDMLHGDRLHGAKLCHLVQANKGGSLPSPCAGSVA